MIELQKNFNKLILEKKTTVPGKQISCPAVDLQKFFFLKVEEKCILLGKAYIACSFAKL